ncbi:cytochrome C [Vibrio kasasachensis]|uniref:multiheme c-type cytochrome n=1 Tax=Vibrio kasasachensis TaxID=2910248 RepID=UPI003D0D821B
MASTLQPNQSAKGFDSQVSNEIEMAQLVKENQRCIRCHRKTRLIKNIAAITSSGKHSSTEFFNNCTACHGVKGMHPKDGMLDTVVPFDDHADIDVFSQNQTCIACHSPAVLREVEWTHDVHANKMTCATCHSMHTDSDPIIGISRKVRIGLCIMCHESLVRGKNHDENSTKPKPNK